ncbi:ATP-dependent RNA helicase DHX8-like, partial [Paramuricea clavata]
MTGTKISLSMKDVDQGTGEDLNPTRMRHNMQGESSAMTRNPDRPSVASVPVYDDDSARDKRKVQRVTSPEKWEIKQ